MISIIIPVYNQAQYLPEAIESALNQKVTDWENSQLNQRVIVVDDGSTDNSLEIAKKYPVKIVSQVNKGLASARNTGIMNATGDYCLFLDADDILKENCCWEIEQKFKETQADIVSPSFRTFGIATQDIILMPEPKLEDFRTGNRVGYCSAVKRSVLLEVGGYNPKMVEGYEDLALWCLLLSKGKKIVTIPEVLWLYRTKESSMWKDALKHHSKLIAQINKDVPEAQLVF